MTERIYLIGSEEVQRGGQAISSAAREMKEAASLIEQTLYTHRQFMDDWLARFETILKRGES